MNVSVCLCRPWDVSWSALGRDFNTTLLGAARELLQRAETRRHRADRQKRWLKAKKQVSASLFCIALCVASGWRRKCLLPLKLSRIIKSCLKGFFNFHAVSSHLTKWTPGFHLLKGTCTNTPTLRPLSFFCCNTVCP